MDHKLTLPYINYRGEFSIRSVEPVKVGFQQKNLYHGENCYILSVFCHDKQEFREFAMDDIIRGCFKYALMNTRNNHTDTVIEGLMNKLKGGLDES